jgi:lipopolysaccharide transport system permease protein
VTPTTVYRSVSPLREPSRFLRSAREDLRTSRGVAWRLFLRDLRNAHRRSLLGYAWVVLPTAVTAGAWIFLQDRGIVSTGEAGVSYALFVLIGTSLWQSFLEALNAPFDKLGGAQGILTKFRLPPEAFILIGLGDVVFNTLIRFALLAVVYPLLADGHPWTIVLAPVGTIALIALGLSIGTLLAPIGTLYSDVRRAVVLIAGIWFFLTPIVYSPDRVSDAQAFNPIAVLIVTTRDWLLTGETRWPGAFVVVVTTVAFLSPVAYLVYRLLAPHLVDRVDA